MMTSIYCVLLIWWWLS